MSNHRLIRRLLLLGLVVLSVAAFAADETNIQPTLHMVAMRDGTQLATDVYLPAGDDQLVRYYSQSRRAERAGPVPADHRPDRPRAFQ